MGYRNPDAAPRYPLRCSRGLAAGTATSSGGIIYEVIPVFGALRVRARIKTATNGGTLDMFAVGPDFDVKLAESGATAFASLVGTIYTSGNATQAAVAAATETKCDLDLYGEGYVILKFVGSVGAGTITYVDVSMHMDHE